MKSGDETLAVLACNSNLEGQINNDTKMTRGCMSGAVRFETTGDPFAVNHFHCYTLDADPESVVGQQRKSAEAMEMSGVGGEADVICTKADIKTILTFRALPQSMPA